MAANPSLKKRRTHSVHNSERAARKAASDLAHLMNGVPCGYAFYIQQRMGKWAFYSAPVER